MRSRRVIATVAAVSVIGVIPPMLVGTLALPIRRELGFDEAALGLAVSSRAAAAALLAYYLGRLAQRLGPERAIRLATLSGAGISLGIAVGVHSYLALLAALAGAGLVHALAQPAADLWIVRGVAPERQGLGFGVKQAAMPGASLLAGLAVPALALTVGWRWAFVGVAVLALAVAVSLPSTAGAVRTKEHTSRSGDAPVGAMAFMVLGMALAAGPPNALTTFLVSSLVEAGTSEATAGLLFAAGALVGVSTRVVLGHRADRGRPQLPIVITMLAGGAAGYALLATMTQVWMIIASPIVFAMAWGWPGIFFLAMARANPNAPATASGMINVGGFVGAIAGPIVFGLVARESYGLGWLIVGASSFAAAVLFWMGLRRLRRWAYADSPSQA